MHSATRSQGRGLAPCSDARPAQYLPTREKGPAKAGPLVPASGYPPSFALLAQLVEHLHGKEGVSGSSPEEGSHRNPANVELCFPVAHFLQGLRVWNTFGTARCGGLRFCCLSRHQRLRGHHSGGIDRATSKVRQSFVRA